MGSGRWAAMFGLLNVFFRPLGGVVADIIYKYTGSVWGKKIWIVFCGVTMGCFELAIGLLNPHHEATMFGLIAGLAVFMDAANGANFAVVPHVHPFANGILSGIIGATGNLGGIIFAIIFRYNGKDYAKVFGSLVLFQLVLMSLLDGSDRFLRTRLVGSKLLTRIVFFLAVLFDERASVRVARGVRIEIGCIVF